MFVQTHFFFQAEDGIRDTSVTGVQTCALPICCADHALLPGAGRLAGGADPLSVFLHASVAAVPHRALRTARAAGRHRALLSHPGARLCAAFRSEERRVGKECRSRWWTTA